MAFGRGKELKSTGEFGFLILEFGGFIEIFSIFRILLEEGCLAEGRVLIYYVYNLELIISIDLICIYTDLDLQFRYGYL